MSHVPRNEHFVGRVDQDFVNGRVDQGFYRQWPAAENTRRHALSLREETFRKAQVETFVSKNELVLALDKQGKYEEAAAMNKQTLVLAERVLGREHPETLISMSNMGRVLGHQGKYEEAEVMNRQTLAVFETVLGREDPETLASMSNVALMLGLQGKYEEAEVMNRQTLALKETVLGREHPQTLTSMSNLVGVLELQGKFNEAEAMIVQMLALKETLLGEEDHETLTCISQLGSVLQMQGKYEEAISMHRRMLQGREKLLGREHPDTLTSISQLGSALESQRKHEEAENLARENHEANPVLEHQASVTPGTYVGQNNVGISQAETLIEWDERTTMSEKTTFCIAHILADDDEMHVLCSSVLDIIDREQFVDVGQQLLKSFYRGLVKNANTELERQSAGLLESRSDRKKICEDIADIVKFEDTQNEEEEARAAEQLQLAGQRLVEMFTQDSLNTYPDPDPGHPPEKRGKLPTDYNDEDMFSDRGLESESESEYDYLPTLTRITEFFRGSNPFQVLLNDLGIQILPYPLRDIMQAAPHGSLWLSHQDNNSFFNRVKAFVEDFTVLEWNWWPFEPRMKNLNSSEMRLFWHCVSIQFAMLLKLILYSLVVHGFGKRFPGKTPT
jgi:tetratricopeptide (TPR) repeat protein